MAVFGKDSGQGSQRIISEMINKINDNMRRLRVVEQQLKSLDVRVNSVEQSMLSQKKNLKKLLGERDEKTTSLESRIFKIESTMKEMVKQMKTNATKSDIEELKTMVDIFNPLTSKFATKEEMERLVEKKMSMSGGD